MRPASPTRKSRSSAGHHWLPAQSPVINWLFPQAPSFPPALTPPRPHRSPVIRGPAAVIPTGSAQAHAPTKVPVLIWVCPWVCPWVCYHWIPRRRTFLTNSPRQCWSLIEPRSGACRAIPVVALTSNRASSPCVPQRRLLLDGCGTRRLPYIPPQRLPRQVSPVVALASEGPASATDGGRTPGARHASRTRACHPTSAP